MLPRPGEDAGFETTHSRVRPARLIPIARSRQPRYYHGNCGAVLAGVCFHQLTEIPNNDIIQILES